MFPSSGLTARLASRRLRTEAPAAALGLTCTRAGFAKKAYRGDQPKRRGRSRPRNYERRMMRLDIVKKHEARHMDLESRASALGLKWDIAATTIVERCPVLIPDSPQWEDDFERLSDSLAYYKHRDWPEGLGPRHPDNPLSDEEAAPPFELAPRVTTADGTGDTRTMDRALTQTLFLVLKSKEGGDWKLPMAVQRPGEMLGAASVRAVAEALDTSNSSCAPLRLFHFKRQPMGHLFEEYGGETQGETKRFGVKRFIYSALVIDPYETIFSDKPMALKAPYSDFSWLTKEELTGEKLSEDGKTWEAVKVKAEADLSANPEFAPYLKNLLTE
mmetsp:Transcript_65856/g.148593  ORF Transcript_65856/g.148593 Transcript_65856/m.148593 type:complete len:330 (+) Transcript_65856:50-1039(+)